jgi:deoxycytidylate deaminase
MRMKWNKCDIYVVRLNPTSELKKSKKQNNNNVNYNYSGTNTDDTYNSAQCYSRPCSICVQKMVKFGVKRVFYSTSDGWQAERVQTMWENEDSLYKTKGVLLTELRE